MDAQIKNDNLESRCTVYQPKTVNTTGIRTNELYVGLNDINIYLIDYYD